MNKPLNRKLSDIDNANLHKLGKLPKKLVRFWWFMRNGLFSSSNWKLSRLLCLFNSHDWLKDYDIKDLDFDTLDMEIKCGRCWYTHNFSLTGNNLFYLLTSLIEVKTPKTIEFMERLRDAGVKFTPSPYENRKTKKEFISILEICLKELKK